MNICAIITEYNPFHAGHAYQIEEVRRRLPDCAVISLMSGNYVQRGEPAIWDKYLRAACAVDAGGPDLVLELPLTAALSSAEGFAQGGIHLAAALGCVTHLSFGCETGTEEYLMQLAACLNTDEFSARLRALLPNSASYAHAAAAAAQELCPQAASLLDSPNDLLAVQYCRFLQQICPGVQPIAVRRRGAAHDGTPEDGIPSASHVRRLLRAGRADEAFDLLPSACRERGSVARRHSWDDLASAVLPYLRRLTPEDIRALPGVSEGLENRFYQACQKAQTLDELWDRVRSRRHPLSRVRRLVLCAYLGITQKLTALPPAFVTVLAMNTRGREVLRTMKQTCSLPVIVKPTQARTLTGTAARLWNLTLSADDQFYFPAPAGTSWTQTPFYRRPY